MTGWRQGLLQPPSIRAKLKVPTILIAFISTVLIQKVLDGLNTRSFYSKLIILESNQANINDFNGYEQFWTNGVNMFLINNTNKFPNIQILPNSFNFVNRAQIF